jgi:hypothetical protein
MSDPVNPNPIFPITVHLRDSETHIEWGLSKREYYAAMAMQGLLATDRYQEIAIAAEDAVRYADVLIKKLDGVEDDDE